jgi:hypothetical protein
MVKPRQDARGNLTARKRLPDDVRDEFKRLYGQSHEVKFFAPAALGRNEALQVPREAGDA